MSAIRSAILKQIERASTLSTHHLIKALKDHDVGDNLAKAYVASFRILVSVGQYPCTEIRYDSGVVRAVFKDNARIDKQKVADILVEGGVRGVTEGEQTVVSDLLIFAIDNADRIIIMQEKR